MTELVYYVCTCNLNHHQNVGTYNNFNQWRTILERYRASLVTTERTSELEEDTNLFMNQYIRFLITARQLGTLFTTNIKLALQCVGRWCMNLKALVYATFNLCILCTEKFHHNWQVYIGVQNDRNKVFFTSMEHI